MPHSPAHSTVDEVASSWWLFVHNLGGDMVAVRAPSKDVAAQTMAAEFKRPVPQLFEESVCCCGPSWTLWGGSNDDGSWPDRPAESVLGMEPRYTGRPRATYLDAGAK